MFNLSKWQLNVVLGVVWLATVFAYLMTFFFFFDYTSVLRLDPFSTVTLSAMMAGLLAYPVVRWFIEATEISRYSREKQKITPDIEVAKEEVWNELSKLPADAFTVLRNVVPDWKYGTIDFVVVGRNGVTLVEVKNPIGSVEFRDGKLFANDLPMKSDVFRWVTKAYKTLSRFLRPIVEHVPITSVIVFTRRSKLIVSSQDIPIPNTLLTETDRVNELFLRPSGSFMNSQRMKQLIDALRPLCRT